MLLNVHEDPYNVHLTRLKLTHVVPPGGGGAVMVDGWLRPPCSCGAGPGRDVVGEPVPEEKCRR